MWNPTLSLSKGKQLQHPRLISTMSFHKSQPLHKEYEQREIFSVSEFNQFLMQTTNLFDGNFLDWWSFLISESIKDERSSWWQKLWKLVPAILWQESVYENWYSLILRQFAGCFLGCFPRSKFIYQVVFTENLSGLHIPTSRVCPIFTKK
jgi:hypothetical protein